MNSILTRISDIKLNPNNPRLIKDDKFTKLVKSIKDFPEMLNIRPIVVNSDMVILGGNMRYKACKEAGLKEIPVIIASDFTEEQQREFLIKDNVSGGEWDFEMLANEWDVNDLEEWGLDIPNFESKELEEELLEDDIDINIKETIIKKGDLIEIGSHRLFCGDSFNSEDLNKLMNGNKAKLIFTDPPYDLENEEYSSNIFMFSENAHVFVMHDDRGIVNYLRNSALEFKQFFVANFGFSSPRGNDPYLSHILISHEKNGEAIKHKNMHDGIRSIMPMEYRFRMKEENYGHKHQKPINFIKTFIEHYSEEKFVVLDLFGGSGSTMHASHICNRICYTNEYEPLNCQIIIDRMKKLDSNLVIKLNGELWHTIK